MSVARGVCAVVGVGGRGPGDGSAAHTFLLPPAILFSPFLPMKGEGWTAWEMGRLLGADGL